MRAAAVEISLLGADLEGRIECAPRVEARSGTITAPGRSKGVAAQQKRTGMLKDARNKAAEHHDNAARSH
jgi:hypothetical protein